MEQEPGALKGLKIPWSPSQTPGPVYAITFILDARTPAGPHQSLSHHELVACHLRK